MTVHDVGKGYKWRVSQKRDWLIVVAFVCLVCAMASLTVMRFHLPGVRIAEALLWGASVVAMVMLFEWIRRNPSVDVSRFFGSRSRTKKIDKLYAELRPLMDRALKDPSLKGEVDARLSLLHQLQTEEAEEMRKRFEAGLLLTPEESQQALDRAKALIAQYGNPSSPDSSAKS